MSQFKRVLIAIPSYWIFDRKREAVQHTYELYDHPTETPRYETISRLLTSLGRLDTKGLDVSIVILVAAEHGRARYERFIKKLVEKSKLDKELKIIFERGLADIKRELGSLGYPMVKGGMGLHGYSSVRNVGLFLAQILGCDAIFFLDDDVIIADGKVLKTLIRASIEEGAGVTGGVYTDRKGRYVLNEEVDCWKHFWNKNKDINYVLRSLENRERIETIVMFGGNMLISRDVFQRIPFDPLVPRGEDIDYAINARYFGFKTLLCRNAGVIHLPPGTQKSYMINYWSKLRGDVSRFLYERQKLSAMGISVRELPDYPRRFMQNIRIRAIMTTLLLMSRSVVLANFDSTKENMLNLKRFLWDFPRMASRCKYEYFRFQRNWERLMSAIESGRQGSETGIDLQGLL